MSTLTETQIIALRWLNDFPSNKSGWRRENRPAFGPSQKWDAIKIEGLGGSIVIGDIDWFALLPFIESIPDDRRLFAPNVEGRKVLGLESPAPHKP